ncbi:enoyl-CoA hydratase-related protein [Microvirga pudoricolor]|uniref:enoyl-CoA hydratase-related protein n=1 Tax=Microvirga pudoricolor TaxID=2778729 RepID=UPI00195014E2|nr:enoyl-CoA hydratase-related protein [Microvirga pudoricolor]MBM6594643.1 enoyl-CoA hydratase/isomerase family protein [Microvirga pudoricolor]
MNLTTLHLAMANSVATVTLSRPDKLNALTAVMHAELREVLGRLAGDDAVKVVVLTGAGRAFSSGQDLTEDLPRDDGGRIDLGPPLARDYNPLVTTLADYPKITIAALNGPAVGASMNIALACDIVVAARSAYLQEAFAKIALIPDAGGTWILPRLVGPKRALALMLTAEPVPAEEALRMGLVSKVFEDATFKTDVAAHAAQLAQGPALAYRLIKEAVRESLSNTLEEQLAVEARLQAQAGFSDDFAEGVRAFREKRAPRFEGR